MQRSAGPWFTTRVLGPLSVVGVALLCTPAASAQEPAAEGERARTAAGQQVEHEQVTAEPEEAPRTFVDLRLGATSTETWSQVCAAGYPFEMLALEACGNGSGFLHRQGAPEIAHFRGKVRLLQQAVGPVYVEPWLGLGFAELQIAADEPGFDFFGPGPTGVETAGAELGGALRAVWPLWAGFEVIGNVDLSLAYFPEAPDLVRPMSPWQPTVSADVGIGW